MKIRETIKQIEDNNLYDYVANNYHNASVDDLKNIILELDYALSDVLRNSPHLYDRAKALIIQNLKERYSYEFEDEDVTV
jgi:soluble P-type ATPase